MLTLEELLRAPEKPGVYLFKNKGRPIYIGKAKNLRERLLQHFKLAERDSKERAIVSNADTVEWLITKNEYEALTLEVDLIQLHKPRYNVLHKYGGGYPLLLITNEPYPTVKVVRGTDHDGLLFGPFFSTSKAIKVKRLLHKTFKLRTCDPMPQRKEPCMDYHIGLCSAPCCGNMGREDYMLSVRSAVSLLSGDVAKVLEELYQKIEEEMQRLNFERCAVIRDQIQALENLSKGQRVSGLEVKHADAFYLLGRHLGIFLIRSGKVVDKRVELLEREEELDEVLMGFYYANPLPPVIMVNFEPPEEVLWWLGQRGSFELRDIDPKLEEFFRENTQSHMDLGLLEEEFKRVLGIPLPKRIEGFDISHFYGDYTVGSCVVWEEGMMNKRAYRRYRIKSVKDIDDYASLQEVLTRRAKRLKASEEPMPDLWLVDGGKGQLSVALSVKRKFDLPVRVCALAKEEEVLHTEDGKEVRLKEHPMLYRVFGLIRDEAHRFALSYNRKLRLKEGLADVLSKVKGIGEVKRRIIYRNFENLYELLRAEDYQLKRLGINPAIKQEVERYLRSV